MGPGLLQRGALSLSGPVSPTLRTLHYISITFKVLASCIPPPKWKGGWPCFLASLGFLVGLMAVVTEVAEQFGCNMSLSPLMTGISVVALGTSLPDTFGSRYAAIKDPTVSPSFWGNPLRKALDCAQSDRVRDR